MTPPDGYVKPDRICFVCGLPSNKAYKVGGFHIVSCCRKHAEMTIRGECVKQKVERK